jgi:hypothetical protein
MDVKVNIQKYNQYVRNLDKREVIVRLVDVGGIQVRIEFCFLLKVANIRCFILIAVEICHNIIRK